MSNSKLPPAAQPIIDAVAAEIIKVEIATDPALQTMICETVVDAARGRVYARDWLRSREGDLLLDAFDRFLSEGGKIPRSVLSDVVTRR